MYHDGSVYEGEWRDGREEGWGKQTKVVEEGWWSLGIIEGKARKEMNVG
jgi:hypothetical protein